MEQHYFSCNYIIRTSVFNTYSTHCHIFRYTEEATTKLHHWYIYYIDICGDTHSRCEDTEGSYACICFDGYYNEGDICVDVDECEQDMYNCSSHAVEHGYGVSVAIS